MDVQKHFPRFLLIRQELLFDVLPDNFDFKTTIPIAFRVIIRKEMSIHILTLQGVSIVAADNTVWINYRNDPCLVQFTELVR